MSGVVFDTSIWIEYFKANPTYFETCRNLLEEGNVYSLEIIFAELMQGAKGKREIGIINGHFENLPLLDRQGLIFESGVFSQNQGLISKGVGLIDSIILFSTVSNGLQLWTLDKKILEHIDKKFKYDPPSLID